MSWKNSIKTSQEMWEASNEIPVSGECMPENWTLKMKLKHAREVQKSENCS